MRASAKKISLLAAFTALGVALAPFAWFQFLTTKANPTQHLVNALAGVVLGPWWAMVAALFIGVIRNMLGIGTVYAFPGGLPGALVVGLSYILTRRARSRFIKYSAALLEPIGTVLIGGTLSLILVAPLIGDVNLTGKVLERGLLQFLPIFGAGWAVSSIPGAIAGYLILIALDKAGVLSQFTG